jgi:hypothetical protein
MVAAMMTPRAPSRPPAGDPHRMPGQYWAYGFWFLVGAAVLPLCFGLQVDHLRWLWALADLRPAPGLSESGPEGAVFRGRLAGEARRTPLGHDAVAWLGVVRKIQRHAKGSSISEECRVGALDGLSLETGAGRLPIEAPRPSDVLTDRGPSMAVPHRRLWTLGARGKSSQIPAEVFGRCASLTLAALQRDEWDYIEERAAAGDAADVAGCVRGGAIAPCPSGAAAGHLATGGMRALVVALADDEMFMMSFIAVILMFFAIVAGIGAVLALRRAAIESGGVL